MLKSKLSKKTEGFTIIEVLIVLAIAGLIFLIVFLAVPQLRRNQRNNARKSDVSKVLAAISEYAGNHGGLLPASSAEVQNVVAGFTWAHPGYTGASVTYQNGTFTNNTTENTLVVVTGALCDATNISATATGATNRDFVVLFSTEPANAANRACQRG
jgi:prepilin-type N-terminal cleavage/methylation domain-containing protein